MSDHETQLYVPKQNKPTMRDRAVGLHREMTTAEVDSLPTRARRIWVRLYRFAILLYDGFLRTGLTRRASALTYTTILSLFPFLAVVTAVIPSILPPEREKAMMEQLEERFLPASKIGRLPEMLTPEDKVLVQQQEEKSREMRDLFRNVMKGIREGAAGAGAFGFLGLVITAGLLYYSIEATVNETWKSEHRVTWAKTANNFLIVMFVVPVLLISTASASSLINTFLTPEKEPAPELAGPPKPAEMAPAKPTQQDITQHAMVRKIRRVTSVFGFVLPLVPILVNALILSLVYSFLPRTRVFFRYALLGGLVSALLWDFARHLFFLYVYSSMINKTLAQTIGLSVVFLLWIYITWLVLLAGNLIVYTSQNYRALWGEHRTGEQIQIDGRLIVALMVLLARRFTSSGGGLTENEIRERLGMRQEDFNSLAARLMREGYVTRLIGDAYQVAHPPASISVRELLGLGCDVSRLPIAERGRGIVGEVLARLQERTLALCGDETLEDLLAGARPGSSDDV